MPVKTNTRPRDLQDEDEGSDGDGEEGGKEGEEGLPSSSRCVSAGLQDGQLSLSLPLAYAYPGPTSYSFDSQRSPDSSPDSSASAGVSFPPLPFPPAAAGELMLQSPRLILVENPLSLPQLPDELVPGDFMTLAPMDGSCGDGRCQRSVSFDASFLSPTQQRMLVMRRARRPALLWRDDGTHVTSCCNDDVDSLLSAGSDDVCGGSLLLQTAP